MEVCGQPCSPTDSPLIKTPGTMDYVGLRDSTEALGMRKNLFPLPESNHNSSAAQSLYSSAPCLLLNKERHKFCQHSDVCIQRQLEAFHGMITQNFPNENVTM